MNVIRIRDNFPQVAAALDRAAVEAGNKAMVRALNDTIATGKVQMAKQISSEFRVTSSQVKQRLQVSRASARGELRFYATLSASNRGKGRSMNLISFLVGGKVSKAAAKRRGSPGLAGQLQFQIKRGGGRKVIPGAFVGNAGRTVFVRIPGTSMASRSKYSGTKYAEQIKALSTIDVPQMFNTRRINEVVRKVIIDKFGDNFKRELRAVLGGFAR